MSLLNTHTQKKKHSVSYETLDVKHIQLDTLSYIIFDDCVKCVSSLIIHQTILRLEIHVQPQIYYTYTTH